MTRLPEVGYRTLAVAMTAAAVVAGLTLSGSLVGFIVIGQPDLPYPTLATISLFSVGQALLSTGLALIVGGCGGFFLHSLPRLLAGILRLVLFLCCILPPVLVVLATISSWGGDRLSTTWGINIFSLFGIVIAHGFSNTALVALVVADVLQQRPARLVTAANELNLSFSQQLRLIDVPLLAPPLAVTALIAYYYCFNSFAVVQAFGGIANNFEVAIYTALRGHGTYAQVLAFSALQFILLLPFVVGVILLLRFYNQRAALNLDDAAYAVQPIRTHSGLRTALVVIGAIGLTILCLWPLLALGIDIISALLSASLPRLPWLGAVLHSLLIAAIAIAIAILTCLAGLYLTRWRYLLLAGWLLPVAALSAGLVAFMLIVFRIAVIPAPIGALIIAAIVALSLVPVLGLLLIPPLYRQRQQQQLAISELNLSRWRQFVWLELPVLRPRLLLLLPLIGCWALGDAAAIQIIAPTALTTIPSLMLSAINSYRLDYAYALAGIFMAMVSLILALIAFFRR